jgi:hypothetical protein
MSDQPAVDVGADPGGEAAARNTPWSCRTRGVVVPFGSPSIVLCWLISTYRMTAPSRTPPAAGKPNRVVTPVCESRAEVQPRGVGRDLSQGLTGTPGWRASRRARARELVWGPPRLAERTGHLSAPAGPLAPQRGMDRPLRANRVTVTVSDLSRQPFGQRSSAAISLPQRSPCHPKSVWFTQSLRYETWPATWVSAAHRFCGSPRLSGYGSAARPAS